MGAAAAVASVSERKTDGDKPSVGENADGIRAIC